MKTNRFEKVNKLEKVIESNWILSEMDVLIKAKCFNTLEYYFTSLVRYAEAEGITVDSLVDLLTIAEDNDFGFATVSSQPGISTEDSAVLWALGQYTMFSKPIPGDPGYRILRNLNK